MKAYKINFKQIQIGITYICVFMLSLNLLLSATGIQDNRSELVRFVIVGVLIINFFTYRFIKISRYDVIILIVCLIYYLIFNQSVALNILVLYVIAFYLKNDTYKNIKHKFLVILFFCIVLWCLLLVFGIITDSVSVAYGRTRHYLGFNNINQSSLLTLPFLILLYDRMKDRKIFRCLVLGLAMLLFYLTDTRASFYVMLMYVVMSAIPNSEKLKKWKRVISIGVLILIPLLTIFFLFSNRVLSVFPFIDELLTMRLSIIVEKSSNLTLFNYVFGMRELLLDNSYVMFFTTFGVVGYVWWLGWIKNSLFLIRDFEWKYMVVVLIYGFFESTLLIPESILAMLFFVILIKNRT